MKNRDYSYQDDAIKSICHKFESSFNAKALLVIPTGGGKTLTAIRAVNEMLVKGIFQETDCVYWVVHSIALKDQTLSVLNDSITFGSFLNCLEDCHKALANVLQIKMLTDAVANHNQDCPKLIIIDEAHHSAAQSYKVFFNDSYGVLGLTATPTRNDDKDLAFNDVVFSISTKELIRRNVIIKPIIHSIKTGAHIDVTSLVESGVSKFNFPARNTFVAEKIFSGKNFYQKSILYVNTREHAKALYAALTHHNTSSSARYDHIGYILGGDDNSLSISNKEYLAYLKTQKSALVVNCGVLTEGFDDPEINAVIMVVPTSSVIFYLQCVGRAIRTPNQSSSNLAYVVEFEDDMPNIHYRIDNKWLFADISDRLEPQVIEKDYNSSVEFSNIIDQINAEYNIVLDKKLIEEACNGDYEQISILVYNSTQLLREDAWKFILFNPNNYRAYSKIFNVLSNRVQDFPEVNVNWLFDTKFKFEDPDGIFQFEYQKTNLYSCIEKAYQERCDKLKVERLKYFIFNKTEELPLDFLEFIADCLNTESLKFDYQQMKSKSFHSVIKIPLALGGFEGVYLNEHQSDFCLRHIENLKLIKDGEDWTNWSQSVYSLNNLLSEVPISPRHFMALPSILGINYNYYLYKI